MCRNVLLLINDALKLYFNSLFKQNITSYVSRHIVDSSKCQEIVSKRIKNNVILNFRLNHFPLLNIHKPLCVYTMFNHKNEKQNKTRYSLLSQPFIKGCNTQLKIESILKIYRKTV